MADIKFSEIELEIPQAADPLAGAVGGELFGAEAMAVVSRKLLVSEELLRLASRDCKFVDFTRELLMVAMRAIKSEAGSLLEFDAKSNQLFFRAVVGTSSDKVAHYMIPMGQGIVGHVAESRQPFVVCDAKKNEIHLKVIDDAVGFTTRNLVALPVVVRGQLYGVIELINRVGEKEYLKSDVELLGYFSEMAAKALEIRFMLAFAAASGSQKKQEAA